MKKLILAVAVAAVTLSACTKEEIKNNKAVAVFIPSSESSVRWKTDKDCLAEALSALKLDYSMFVAAEGDGAATQIEQISNAINSGIKTMIIAPVDFNAILSSKIFEGRSDLNIICHDRMLYNCTDVDFYSACDNSEIGGLQASFLVQAFVASGEPSMTLEMLAGPVSDLNSKLFFDGAWKILKPYVDNGTIKVVSGKTSYEAVAMDNWEMNQAESVMKERLSKYYPGGFVPNLILAPNDETAIGTVKAIESHNPAIKSYPTITGQDNTEAVRAYIKAGKISMTIEKSIKEMSYNSANMANMLVNGLNPVSPSTFNNGVKDVPFVTSSPKIITKSNL